MKRISRGFFAGLFMAGLSVSPALAQQSDVQLISHAELMSVLDEQNARIAQLETSGGAAHGDCTSGQCGTCDSCVAYETCHPSGIFAEAEATFFRFHRADGVRVGLGDDDDVEFDFEISPRLTIGYVSDDGFGIRTRWWDYDHEADSDGGANVLAVDTHIIDIELFDTFRLNRDWSLEISGGVRYNDFEETMVDGAAVRSNEFNGWGGITGLEVKRCIGENSALYARVRGAILMDDKFVDNVAAPQGDRLLDSTQGMMELGLGYEYNRYVGAGASVFATAGVEWQNWYNYSSSFAAVEDEFSGPSDVGFGGFTASIGVAR